MLGDRLAKAYADASALEARRQADAAGNLAAKVHHQPGAGRHNLIVTLANACVALVAVLAHQGLRTRNPL